MSSAVYRMQRYCDADLHELSTYITSAMEDGFIIPELVHRQLSRVGNAQVLLLAYERYYMRTSSAASLTIQVTSDGELQKALIIGTGGGEGFMNLSWGANRNFANRAFDILEAAGFVEP